MCACVKVFIYVDQSKKMFRQNIKTNRNSRKIRKSLRICLRKISFAKKSSLMHNRMRSGSYQQPGCPKSGNQNKQTNKIIIIINNIGYKYNKNGINKRLAIKFVFLKLLVVLAITILESWGSD